jgi:plastocyanin
MKLVSTGAIVAAALAALPGAIAAPTGGGGVHTLVVTSYEYSFQAPETIAAGVVTVRLVNRGKSGHQVAFAMLDDSSSLTRVMRSLVDDKKRTTGIRWMGGVESALAGDSSETTLALPSGRYVIVCSYDGPQGHAHVSMGMIRPLTVSPGLAASDSALPPTETTIHLSDYQIALSGPVRSGHHLVRVQNDGAHFHHLIFSRIVGKATMADLDKWDGKSRPAPIEDVSGGAAVLSPGRASVIALDLKPGRYAVACILSDGPGARPHYMLGMEKEIAVK